MSVLEGGVGVLPLLDSNWDLARALVEARRSHTQAYLERLAAQFRDRGIEVESAVLEGMADQTILDSMPESMKSIA